MPVNDSNHSYGIETRAVHAGAAPDPVTGARNVPIYQTTSYVFRDADHAAALFDLEEPGFIYTRLGNPTVAALEARVAALEGGTAAVAAASGHSAQLLTFYTLMSPGDHFVASRFLYGGSITQFSHTFPRLGWNGTLVDPRNYEEVRAAITPRTKLIFTESLANPGGVVVDVEALAEIAHEAGIPLVVDNTLATPYLWNPFEWGADIIVHSMTKFLSGHGTSLGGVVVESGRFDWNGDGGGGGAAGGGAAGDGDTAGARAARLAGAAAGKFPALTEPDPAYHGLDFYETFGETAFATKTRAVALRDLGPALSPQNAFYILTGIETLPLRMARHSSNALAVAEHLAEHPAVAWVSYAGLPSSPYAALAAKYLPRGAGSVFTIGLKGGYDAGVKLVAGVELWSHLANVGDTRSLIIHPASTTHRQLTDEQRDAAGAGNDVIRLSVGIETVADLIADLDQALAQAMRD
jgi:O-acetylhomoserine (thiol)-lyase